MLGDATKVYESGTSGPGTISSGYNDAGGKSYGTYQLSTAAGQVLAFIDKEGYEDVFSGMEIGGQLFDSEWKKQALDPEFAQAQWNYIKTMHYDPCREYADTFPYLNTTAIDEALWSISVQHGGWKTILDRADSTISNLNDEKATINALYDARNAYVRSIGMGYLINQRYISERQDILALVGT